MDKDKAISGYEKIFDDGYRAGRASVVLPHPCDGELYKDWTAADYFAKIAEEHLEVIDAYKEIERNGGLSQHFLRECTDLIVATTGLMNYLGCDEKMRQEYMQEVNESNAKRDGGRRFAKHPLNETGKQFKVEDKAKIAIPAKKFKVGDKVKISVPAKYIGQGFSFTAEMDVFKSSITALLINEKIGTVIDCNYDNDRIHTVGRIYTVEVKDKKYKVPEEWLKKVEE